jgi:hypothetical protein
MRHPLWALCEGLETCRLVDCQELIPEGHALGGHCEAALADDFAPDGPDDVFYRTPEPWGRPPTVAVVGVDACETVYKSRGYSNRHAPAASGSMRCIKCK